uniref:Uncharacterized protein n=1 Tax=Arundo donax TaxID=35708 RepID=A0A0A9F9A6_ARUDO
MLLNNQSSNHKRVNIKKNAKIPFRHGKTDHREHEIYRVY